MQSSHRVDELCLHAVQYGLGPIGCEIVRVAARKPNLKIVAGVDVAPAKVGRDVGEVSGLGRALGGPVTTTLREALAGQPAHLAFHATGSSLAQVLPQLTELVSAGLNVVSTCEELAYPWRRNRELATEVDALARQHGVTVLGSGVNPGFVMDTLAIVSTGLCPQVCRVHINRRVDTATRRGPLQLKTGAGRTVADFEKEAAERRIGHVGLPESLDMVADALGWELQRVEEELTPVVATEPLATEVVQVARGDVAGLRQVARGYRNGQEVLCLELKMALRLPDPGDTIVITGPPDLTLRLEGVQGDRATAAVVVNSAPRVVAAKPGLVTMRDLAPVAALPGAT